MGELVKDDTERLSSEFVDREGAIDSYSDYSTTVQPPSKTSRVAGKASRYAAGTAGATGRRRSASNKLSQTEPANADVLKQIIGSSAEIDEVRRKVREFAGSPHPVCIIGESGVGKELVANALHKLSGRRDGPFVDINASAITETLSTAELFGHQKGSFTGANTDRDGRFKDADGGTLYLDEIGDLPASIQAQLLRVVEDGKVAKIGARSPDNVDVRLITATNKDLQEEVREGRFRADLYYRITVLMIDVPPLRERGDDVVEIAEHLIATQAQKDLRAAVLTPRAADLLRGQSFSGGNVRELRNLVARASLNARGGKIMPDHLQFDAYPTSKSIEEVTGLKEGRDLISRYIAATVLLAANGKMAKAAKMAGVGRDALYTVAKQMNGKDYAAEQNEARKQLNSLLNK